MKGDGRTNHSREVMTGKAALSFSRLDNHDDAPMESMHLAGTLLGTPSLKQSAVNPDFLDEVVRLFWRMEKVTKKFEPHLSSAREMWRANVPPPQTQQSSNLEKNKHFVCLAFLFYSQTTMISLVAGLFILSSALSVLSKGKEQSVKA